MSCNLGDAPVQHLHFTKFPHPDVLGLQVPVHHPVDVRVRACLARLDHHFDQAFSRKGLLGDPILPAESLQHLEQIFARDALHREVQAVPVVTSDLVYGDGVGMLKLGGDPGLSKKAPPLGRVSRTLRTQRFDRNPAAHYRIPTRPQLGFRTTSDRFELAVFPITRWQIVGEIEIGRAKHNL